MSTWTTQCPESDRSFPHTQPSLRITPRPRSLSPECTPLKHKYDSCFNAWFEGYLQPAITYSASTSSPNSESSQASSPAPPPPNPNTHHHHPIKERLFSLVPYDPEVDEPELEIEVEDDIEEEEEEEEEEVEEASRDTVLSVQDRAKAKAEEYERNCGGVWKEYRACLQVSEMDVLVNGNIIYIYLIKLIYHF
jgi:hypothetical protein